MLYALPVLKISMLFNGINLNHKSRVHTHSVISFSFSIVSKIFTSSFLVLWLRRDDLKALELMTEIMQRLREGDKKQAKETVLKFIVYID